MDARWAKIINDFVNVHLSYSAFYMYISYSSFSLHIVSVFWKIACTQTTKMLQFVSQTDLCVSNRIIRFFRFVPKRQANITWMSLLCCPGVLFSRPDHQVLPVADGGCTTGQRGRLGLRRYDRHCSRCWRWQFSLGPPCLVPPGLDRQTLYQANRTQH